MVLRSEILVNKSDLPTAQQSLPGRETSMVVPSEHYVHGHSLTDFPTGMQTALLGLGCFWGAERRLWSAPGVWTTAAGYAGGFTPNPTYEETCSGLTGHSEVVLVVFDPAQISYAELLTVFWEAHNPTQGMRQGNDIGTQYRSVIFCNDQAQLEIAEASRQIFQQQLTDAGMGDITTEIAMAPAFYYAEAYHQQYLAKNPGGYCGLGGTGVCMPPA